MKNFLQVNRALRAKKNFNFNFKHLLVLGIALITCINTAWGTDYTITLDDITPSSNWYEVAGVGRVTNKTGGAFSGPDYASSTNCSKQGYKTGSSNFTIQTYLAVSAIKIWAASSSNRDINYVTVQSTATVASSSNTVEYTAPKNGSYHFNKESCDQEVTITFSSEVAANKYINVLLSGNTDIIAVTLVPASCDEDPDEPTGFTVGSITGTGATFSITDAANTNNYEIYYSTSSTAPTPGTSATTTSTSKTKAVTDLTAGTTYYAWVRAKCDASHKSDWVALSGGSFATKAQYTITYNKGVNGTGSISAGSKTEGEDFTLSSSVFTRDGYAQTGWATSDGGSKAYDMGGTYSADAAITLYPVWTATTTYTFDYSNSKSISTLEGEGWTFNSASTTSMTDVGTFVNLVKTFNDNSVTTPTGKGMYDYSIAFAKNTSAYARYEFEDAATVTSVTGTIHVGTTGSFDITIKYLASDKSTVLRTYTLAHNKSDWGSNSINDVTAVANVKCIQIEGASKWQVMDELNITYAATPSCTAPTSPSISGTTTYTAGGTISLTASASGTDASTTYQWYKGDPDNGGVSQGAASTSGATFSKASCVVADGATYYCVISNGEGCTVTTSQAVTVKPSVSVGPTVEDGNYGYRYTTGETIKLTATAGGASSYTYKWQKYVNSAWSDLANGLDATDGGTFSGVTTANLQISGCTTANVGSYRCVVTGGGQTNESTGYRVRVYTLHGYYFGDSEHAVDYPIVWTSETSGVATVSLNESSTYTFKITDNDGKWYGSGAGNYIIQPVSMNCGTSNTNVELRLLTGPAGSYTFTVDITNAQLGNGSDYVSVTTAYPSVTHPADGYIYLKKDWDHCYLYAWYNGSNKLTAWGDAEPEVTTYTSICDYNYFYMPALSYYTNFILHDKRGDGASNSTGNQSFTSNTGKLITHNGVSWVWQNIKKTISFNANGGTGTTAGVKVCPGTDVAAPANGFTRTGWEFDGWCSNKYGKGKKIYKPEDEISDVAADSTFYAMWKKTVYFKVGAGWDGSSAWYAIYCFDSENDNDPYRDWVRMNTAASSCETDVFKGDLPGNGYDKLIVCRMDGSKDALAWGSRWNQTGNISYDELDDNDQFTPTSLDGNSCTGSWSTYSTPTYTISYDKGSTTYTGGNSISGSKDNESKTCAIDFTLPSSVVFTTTGYTQDGWATSDGGSKAYNLGGTYSTDAAATFYPHWAVQTYSLTLNGNGGTGNTANVTATYGSSTLSSSITNPTRDGYVFAGWYSEDGSSSWGKMVIDAAGHLQPNSTFTDASCQWTSTSGQTLYAGWLMVHTPGAYTDTYGQTLTKYDCGYYELYGVSKTKSSIMRLTAGEKVLYENEGTDYSSAANVALTFTNSTLIREDWIEGIIHDNGRIADEQSGANANEFSDFPTTNVRYASMSDGEYLQFCISGYSQFSIIAKDNTVNTKYLKVEIDGVEVTDNQDASAVTVRSYSIANPATTHLIKLTALSGNSSRLCGFSLKVADYPAPTAFSSTAVTTNSVTLSITDAENTNDYEFYINTSSIAPTAESSATHTNTSKTPTISGLSSGTTYYAWVRSKCSSTRKSAWVALSGSTFETEEESGDGCWDPANTAADKLSSGDVSLTTFEKNFSGVDGITSVTIESKSSSEIGGCSGADEATPSGYMKVKNVQDEGNKIITIVISSAKDITIGGEQYGSNSGSFYLVKSTDTSTKLANCTTGNTATASGCVAGTYYVYAITASDNKSINFSLLCIEDASGFTVTYDENGADGGDVPVDDTYYNEDAEVTVLGNTGSLTKTGYAFAGWDTEAEGTGMHYDADDTFEMPAEDITLYAQWEAQTYSITLNANGGAGNTSSVSATYNSATLSVSITNPSKPGNKFDGWYDGSGGTGNLIISTSGVLQASAGTYTGAGGIWTNDDDVTLYAKWSSFSLPNVSDLDVDDGATLSSIPLSWTIPGICDLKNFTTPNVIPSGGVDPYWGVLDEENSEYVEDGDYVIAAGMSPAYGQYGVGFDIPSTSSLSWLSFEWKGEHTSVDLYGTTCDNDNVYHNESSAIRINDDTQWNESGEIIPNQRWWGETLVEAPTVSQVVIFANSAGENKYDDIVFNVRNVRYGISDQNDIDHIVLMRKEGSAATGIADASATKLYEGTKSHYTDASDVTGKNYYYTVFAVHASGAVSTGVSTSLTLYTITYNAGENGTGTVPAGKKTDGIDFTLSSSTFTRDGYTQDGWSTTDGEDKVYELGDTYSTDEALTLYPHWVAVSGPVITNGSPSHGTISITDGTDAILSADAGETVYITATPNTGYNFTSWDVYKTDESGTKVSLAGSTASTTFTMPSYAVTVNASFAAKTYTVTLNGNGGTGNTGNVTATYGSSSFSSSITNPTLLGYVFNGWYSGEGGTGTLIISTAGVLQSSTSYSDGSGNWANDGNVTLYAKWSRDEKTAGWGAPWGGTAIPNATTSTVNSVTLNACNSAKGTLWSKESYTMGNGDSVTINLASGYYISAVSTAALFDEYGGNTNKLYIQFNSQSTYTNSKYDLDEPITLGDDCYKAWGDISTAPLASVSPISAGAQSAKIYCEGNSASGNYLYRIVVEIKAWDCTPSSTVTFAAGTGTGTAPQTRKYCGELTLPDEGLLSKDGYNFAGWNDGEATYFTGETYNVTEDVTFTAQWRDMETPLIIPTVTRLDATNYHYAPAFTKYDVDGSGVIKCINIEGQDSVDWKFKITPGYYSISVAYGAPSGLSTDVTAKIYEVGAVSDKLDRLVMSETFTTGSSDARTRLCSKIFNLNLDKDKTYRIVVKDTYSDESSHPCVGYINFTPLTSPMTIADDESLTYSNVVASPGTVVFDVKDDGNDVTCLNLEDQNMAEWFAYITPNTYTIKMLYGTAAWSTNLTFSIIDPTDGTSVYAPAAVTKSNGEAHWDEEYTWSDVDLTGVSDSKPYIIRVKDTYSSKGSRPKIAKIDFIPTKYELAWSSNGGNALTGDYTSGDVAAGVAITAPDDPTRTGYDFVKWNSAEDGSGNDFNTKMPLGDVTYYAQWEIIDYTIAHSDATNGSYTIKVGDASAVSTNTTGNYNQTVALVATPNSGYVIDAWNVTGATVGNNNIASTSFTMPAGNVTVAPTFKLMPNVYYYQDGTRYASSTYKTPKGEAASTGDNQTINSGNEWTVSNSISGLTVSAKGCTYDGKTGDVIYMTSYLKVPKDGNASNQYVKFVVAAGYKATSLKMKIGGYSSNPAVTLKPYTTELGDAISYTGTVGGVATTENNFNEISWTNLAAGTYYLNVGTNNAYISEITAQTEQVGYTVSFAVDGGSTGYGTVSPSSITEVTHGSTVSISENVLTLKETAVTATPTSASDEYTYAFDSWSVSDGASITSAQTITASFTRTAKEYTLTWDLNGGKVSTAGTAAAVDETEPSGSVAYNTALTAPVVTKNGYDFAGWTPSVADNMPAANTTYTAQWAEQFTVTYNAMTGSVDPTSATGSTANKVSLPEPTKDGYDFDGWYNTAGEKIGDAGDKYGPTAAITLYAKWKGDCESDGVSVAFTSSNKNDAGYNFANMSTSSNTTQMVGDGTAKLIAIGDAKIGTDNKKSGYRSDGRMVMIFKFSEATDLDVYFCAGSSGPGFTLYSFSSANALKDITTSDYETKTAVTSGTAATATFGTCTSAAGGASFNTTSGLASVSSSGGGIKVSYDDLAAGCYVAINASGSESYFYGYDLNGGATPCYQVTYHGNNATSGYVDDPEQYAAGSSVSAKFNSALSGFARTGYEFVEWNTEDDGSGDAYKPFAQITSSIDDDIDLYAQWRIVIDANNTDFAGKDDPTQYRDVKVTKGATLTLTQTTAVRDIIVETGSTLNVSTNSGSPITLSTRSLSLVGGWGTVGEETKYDMPRVFINSASKITKTTKTINFDIAVDNRNFYPIAVPFPVTVSDVDYVNATLAYYSNYGTSGQYVIKTYNGQARANADMSNCWRVMRDGEKHYLTSKGEASEVMVPGQGYILRALPASGYGDYAVIRFPMKNVDDEWTNGGEKGSITVKVEEEDVTTTKNAVSVVAYENNSGGDTKLSNKGWNILGVPYMTCFVSNEIESDETNAYIKGLLNITTGEYTEDGNVYVTVPKHDFSEYDQLNFSEAKLLPGWCFFVQMDKDATLTFDKDGERASAPFRATMYEHKPTVKTGIILSGAEASDKTTILVSDKYSAADYEINADLEKMFGENSYTLATYSLMGETRLAYNAMSNSDATNVIPIGYRAPTDGEYTFAINPRYAENGAFEHVNLIDYETGFVTDLLVSSYSFATERTQNDERFALNVVKRQDVITDIGNGEEVNGERTNGVQKVIINDKLYIIVDGRMYSAEGALVK